MAELGDQALHQNQDMAVLVMPMRGALAAAVACPRGLAPGNCGIDQPLSKVSSLHRNHIGIN